MRFSVDQLTLAAAVLATVASAKPTQKNSAFTVHQVAAPGRSVRMTGAKAFRHAYAKHNMKLPARYEKHTVLHQQKTVKARTKSAAGDGSVSASPVDLSDDEYISPVTVGGQTLNIDFDTGSSDFWVFSSELPAHQLGNHSAYDPSKSTTATLLKGATWNITYGDDSSSAGNVYLDTLNVGGAVVQKQAVELAEQVSDQFATDYNSDGLLGLGFDSINSVVPNPVKTFFTNLRASLEQPLFTIDLNYKAPGSFDFGFINASKYSGEITYLPVNSTQGFWGVTSTSYGVGDNPTMKDKSVSAIVDTGTTLMLVPKKILKAYYKQVEGAKNSNEDQGYIFPCSSVLPDLHIGFGDYTAVVPGSAINNSQVDDTHCYGGLQYSDPSQGPAGIYGDVFLKSSFVVCKHPEGEAPTIGFAAKGTNGSPTQDPASKSTAISKHTSHKSKDKSADSVDDSKDDETEDDDDDLDDDDDYDYKNW